nr:MAK10-like protein [Tanacetum cinerariifolium]
MGDENPICTLGDCSKPSHEGYKNNIELPIGNNVVPLRSGTIRLAQNGCSFHELWSKDPNQHLKDFLKLVDSLDLDGENRERTRLMDSFQGLTLKIPLSWHRPLAPSLNLFDSVNPITRQTIDQSAGDPEQAFVKYASSRNDEARGLVFNFMASQDARLSKFEAKFKQQQSKMTNKINTLLKAITYRIARVLPSGTFKNPKLSTSPVLSVRSYPTEEPLCSTHIHGSINNITIYPKQQNDSRDSMADKEKQERHSDPKETNTIAYIKE